jgi:hypothetical protein
MLSTSAQCAISITVGSFFYLLLLDDPNPKVPLLAALASGFGAAWLAVKLLGRRE